MSLKFKFDNTYTRLPDYLLTRLSPTPVKNPESIIFNFKLAEEMGLDMNGINNQNIADFFSGNKLPPNLEIL